MWIKQEMHLLIIANKITKMRLKDGLSITVLYWILWRSHVAGKNIQYKTIKDQSISYTELLQYATVSFVALCFVVLLLWFIPTLNHVRLGRMLQKFSIFILYLTYFLALLYIPPVLCLFLNTLTVKYIKILRVSLPLSPQLYSFCMTSLTRHPLTTSG